MKQINLLFTALISTQLVAAAITTAHALPAITAKETVYLFDYHDVMAKQDNSIAYRYVRTNIHPLYFLRLIGSLAIFGINKGIKLNKPMLNIEYATLSNVTSKQYADYVLHIINPFTIDQEMLEYVHELKTQGSMTFLFSNVGPQSFEFMGGKKDIDPLFDGKYICTEENNFTNKKSPAAFKTLLYEQILPQYQEQHGVNTCPKRIVMIDDSPEKLAVAAQSLKIEQDLYPEQLNDIQFVPILFKNSAQVKEDIASLA